MHLYILEGLSITLLGALISYKQIQGYPSSLQLFIDNFENCEEEEVFVSLLNIYALVKIEQVSLKLSQ